MCSAPGFAEKDPDIIFKSDTAVLLSALLCMLYFSALIFGTLVKPWVEL